MKLIKLKDNFDKIKNEFDKLKNNFDKLSAKSIDENKLFEKYQEWEKSQKENKASLLYEKVKRVSILLSMEGPICFCQNNLNYPA